MTTLLGITKKHQNTPQEINLKAKHRCFEKDNVIFTGSTFPMMPPVCIVIR